jgi:hypothetical protein
MFEKIGRLAERAATGVSVSRRGFLGRLGQGALAVTGVLGGLLAIRTDARAAGSYVCCTWTCPNGYHGKTKFKSCYPPGTFRYCGQFGVPCFGGTVGQTTVSSCGQCK